MYRELTIEVDGKEYSVGCILPSPLFPLARLAITSVTPAGEDEALAPLLFGTSPAAKIRRATERRVGGARPVPLTLTRELAKLASSAPAGVDGVPAFLDTVTTVLRRGRLRKDPTWEVERFYDCDDWPTVLLYRTLEPTRMFAVVNPLSVKLYLLEERCGVLLDLTLGGLTDDQVFLSAFSLDGAGGKLLKDWLNTAEWSIEEGPAERLSILVGLRLDRARENLETVRAIASGRLLTH